MRCTRPEAIDRTRSHKRLESKQGARIMAQGIDETLRQAMLEDGRTVYELAKQTMLEPDILYRFRDGSDLRLATAAKLAEVLGLELRPKKRTRNVR